MQKQRRRSDSCAVTAQLISAFVFATRIVQFLFYQYPKFKLLALFGDCTAWFVNPNCCFSHEQAHYYNNAECHNVLINALNLPWTQKSDIITTSTSLKTTGSIVLSPLSQSFQPLQFQSILPSFVQFFFSSKALVL